MNVIKTLISGPSPPRSEYGSCYQRRSNFCWQHGIWKLRKSFCFVVL